jgi:hypothetical protein
MEGGNRVMAFGTFNWGPKKGGVIGGRLETTDGEVPICMVPGGWDPPPPGGSGDQGGNTHPHE